ncbi:MAG: ATP-dependent DNA helicase [Cyanobacteria bacterium REEB65]|nr:ATP-dependent DNA helicase [Cyanobacteria bacterium REEB65]
MTFSVDRFTTILSQLPGYEPRPGQIEMAGFIARALETGKHAVIEAGTGSGKSLAYLLPLLEAEGPIVISTGTIALQEQILENDVPFLERALGRPLAVTLAKGRSHYVCRQKLGELDRLMPLADSRRPQVDSLMADLQGAQPWDGDEATLGFAPDSNLWAEIAQSSEDCLGSRCEFFEENPVRVARAQMGTSHLILTNHAMYLADLAASGGILPAHRAVVFDEAHQLPQVATKAFSTAIGRYSQMAIVQKLRRRVAAVPEALALELVDFEARLFERLLATCDGGPMPATSQAAQLEGRTQFRLYPDARFMDIAEGILQALSQLREWLDGEPEPMGIPQQAVEKAPYHRERLRAQLNGLAERWEYFAHEASEVGDRVNWVELDREHGHFELRSAPLNVGRYLREQLWSKRTGILTSATLAVDGDFSYFCGQVGLTGDTLELALPSPFDYQRQATLYIPRYLPSPNEPGYADDSRQVIRNILEFSRGRAFVLFTSYRAMRSAYRALAASLPFPCHYQGEMSRTRLLEWFRHTSAAVLFATASFWEGVDVPGDALSCVIIDRLPFSVPDDPVIQARVERLKAQGRDWFHEFTLPEAIIRLKQGFGRLIRSRDDRGLVAILDIRLYTKSYGPTILKALPSCPLVRDLEDVAP